MQIETQKAKNFTLWVSSYDKAIAKQLYRKRLYAFDPNERWQDGIPKLCIQTE